MKLAKSRRTSERSACASEGQFEKRRGLHATVDARIIVATNRDLEAEVKAGRFVRTFTIA
jgi:hypothetical protein